MIIYGKQSCNYVLQKKLPIKTVYVAKKNVLPQSEFSRHRDKIVFIDNKKAQAYAKGGNHQGLLIEIEDFEPLGLEDVKQSQSVVILSELTDVGNIGAIVRTAYALGIDAVIATGVKTLNFEAIARTSSGALFDMDFALEPNGLDVLNELKQVGFTLYGASMDGEDIEKVHFENKTALVLGSEGKGISGKILKKLDRKIAIRMQRAFDSLNVSVSAGIIIHRITNDITRINR